VPSTAAHSANPITPPPLLPHTRGTTMIDEGLPAAVSISSLSTRKVRCCDSLVFRHMLYAFKKGSSSVVRATVLLPQSRRRSTSLATSRQGRSGLIETPSRSGAHGAERPRGGISQTRMLASRIPRTARGGRPPRGRRPGVRTRNTVQGSHMRPCVSVVRLMSPSALAVAHSTLHTLILGKRQSSEKQPRTRSSQPLRTCGCARFREFTN